MENYNNSEQILVESAGFEYDADLYFDNKTEYEGSYDDFRKDIIIRSEQYAVDYVAKMINLGRIDLSPGFQRKEVWSDLQKKSLFIESLLLNIPIPVLYSYERSSKDWLIIDGKQRLTTIRDFMDGKFALSGLTYLKELHGIKYSDLPITLKYNFEMYQCRFYVLDRNTPMRYVFDIFMRINTGGVPLSTQEIRNVFAKTAVRNLLSDLSNSKEFLSATDSKLKDVRMETQELVLRFIALYRNYDPRFEKLNFSESNLSELLMSTIHQLNDLNDFKEYIERFKLGCRNAKELLGEFAFRRINDKGKPSNVINKSLFSAFTLLMSQDKYRYIDLKKYKESVLSELRYVLKGTLSDYIASGTSSKKNIISTFGIIQSILSVIKES